MVKLNDRLNLTFSALSDQTRRQILFRLRKGTRTVNQLAEPFDMSLAAVSKHLDVLEKAQLIQRKKSGRQVLVSLSVKNLTEAQRWLSNCRMFWEQSLDRLGKYVDEKGKNNDQ